MLSTLFSGVLTTSVSMSIVLAALLLLSPSLNRLYAVRWKYWLWLAAALRMLLPVQLSFTPARYQVEIPSRALPAESLPGSVLFAPLSGGPAPFYRISLLHLLALVWIAGMLGKACFHLVSYRRCKTAYLRWSLPCTDTHILSLAQEEGKRAGLGKLPRIYLCPSIPSPMVIGFFRPCLLLPDREYGPGDLSFILRHEFIHLKRGDIWYKLLLLAACTVHWFNPVGYLLMREAGKDLELLCDDAVVWGLDSHQRKRYGKTMLACAQDRTCRFTLLSTGFQGSARSLRERLHNLFLRKRKGGILTYLLALSALVATSGLILFLPAGAATVIQLQDLTVTIPNGVRGIDVSTYHGEIDWEKVAGDDVHFTFVRATYGLETDPSFRENVEGARAQGLDVGVWHYATYTNHSSMVREAEYFLGELEGAELTLPAALCLMDPPEDGDAAYWTALCSEFLDLVSAAGHPVALNTYSSYLEKYLDGDSLPDVPLWIANYKEEPGLGQQFWQYTSSGSVAGIEGDVDINISYPSNP